MSDLPSRLMSYLALDDAGILLTKYYRGGYTGALFDTAAELDGLSQNEITAHDMAAVALLSVPLSGAAVRGLIVRRADISHHLTLVPDIELVDADDGVLGSLYELQAVLDMVEGVGHVTRSKLLAHKRRGLVPIRDQHILTALVGRDHGPFTEPLRDALRTRPEILTRIDEIRRQPGVPAISAIRAIDVVVWMATMATLKSEHRRPLLSRQPNNAGLA